MLQQQGFLSTWSIQQISPGEEKKGIIEEHIRQATLVVLLLSVDFAACHDCLFAMQRAFTWEKNVLPVLLRPFDWQLLLPNFHSAPLPQNGLPLSLWTYPDSALHEIARTIHTEIDPLGASKLSPLSINNGQKQLLPGNERAIEHTTLLIPHRSEEAYQQHLKNRESMLNLVETIWIKGMLETSLYKQVQIILDLQTKPHSVFNPWYPSMQEIDSSTGPLAIQTVYEAYSQAQGALLILGQPGAGKTTLLFELLSNLLPPARQYSTQPLPVIFHLTSWAEQRFSLDRWLIEDLHKKYDIPLLLAKEWVTRGEIIPLLDGLDEVSPLARNACVEAINDYRQHTGLTPMVVCCRYTEYDELIQRTQQRLHLRRAVLIQPITSSQINTFLSNAGPTLSTLNTAIQNNSQLQELATTPLMLNILAIVYQNTPLEEINATNEIQIFDLYFTHMLKRGNAVIPYNAKTFKKYLSYLAYQLKQRNTTDFYLENIRKDWLPNQNVYRVCIGTLFGFVVGIFIFFIYFATFTFNSFSWTEKLTTSLILASFNTILFALLYGVVLNLLPLPQQATNMQNAKETKNIFFNPRKQFILLINQPIFLSLLVGTLHGLLLTYFIHSYFAMLHGIFFGISYILVGRVDMDRPPAEAVRWNWKNIRLHLKEFFGSGLLFGFLFSLFTPISTLISNFSSNLTISLVSILSEEPLSFLLILITTGLGFGTIFALLGGISYNTLEPEQHKTPNQGIYQSALNSLIFGIPSALFIGLIASLLFGPLSEWIISTTNSSPFILSSSLEGIGWGIGIGFAVMAVVSLRNGLVVCIQHSIYRLLLWRAGVLPWHTIRFLDESAKRIFLNKIGGGYRFIHQRFLEYLASLAPTFVPTPTRFLYIFPLNMSPSEYLPNSSQHKNLFSSDSHQLIYGRWFVQLALISLLVMFGFIAVSGINAYEKRTTMSNLLATATVHLPASFPEHGKLISDALLSTPSFWKNASFPIGTCHFSKRIYHIRVTTPGWTLLCLEPNIYQNYAFSIHILLSRGDCSSIDINYTKHEAIRYRLSICSSGVFSLSKTGNNTLNYLLGPWYDQTQKVVKAGLNQTNVVAFSVQAGKVTLFLNNYSLGTFGDGTPLAGKISLGATSQTGPTEVLYSEAKLWQL